DDGVGGVDVHVGVGRVVLVDADGAQLASGDAGHGAGVGGAAPGGQGHRAGRLGGGGCNRATMPPSWSVAMVAGMRWGWAVAARWMPLENAATWWGSR